MSSSFSPSMSRANTGRHIGSGGGVSRLRSSSSRNSSEPLRRAVADCLSSTSPYLHGSLSIAGSEASRTLREYLAASSTVDLAYSVILEHTLSEKERSPAVVARCIALLKRYLLRYKPSEEILRQIERFCLNVISERGSNANQRLSSWTQALGQQSTGHLASTSASVPPVFSFVSESLGKSLNYVRSLVAQHIPKQSYQPVKFGDTSFTLKKGLPTLSSLLNKSFKSQPSTERGAYLRKEEVSAVEALNASNIEKADRSGVDCVPVDILGWRWHGMQGMMLDYINSKGGLNTQRLCHSRLLEVGAAALFVRDVETQMQAQSQDVFGMADFTNLGEILKPCSVSAIKSSSTLPHLRAITASKRNKQGSHKIWEDSSVSTFHPHAKQLFQYRYYSEQLPLRLNEVEVHEVIASVCSEKALENLTSSRLNKGREKPSVDVAVSVLVKLVIDMYVLDRGIATPLMLSMLEEMVTSSRSTTRAQAFNIIINLGVHAQLLEPVIADDTSAFEGDFSHKTYLERYVSEIRNLEQIKMRTSMATDEFELWILGILSEILLLLVQGEENEESVWASALSCLLYFICDKGRIRTGRLNNLDIRVVKVLLEVSRRNSWAGLVHSKLISMLVIMLYQVADGTHVKFLLEQVEAIGGIQFILFEYSLANSRDDRQNLYLALVDFVLHQKNGSCFNSGVCEYGDDEISFLAYLLTFADTPEVVYVYVKLGLEGIGQVLHQSISHILDGYPNNARINTLLAEVVSKLDSTIYLFTHLNSELKPVMDITKTHKFLNDIDNLNVERGASMEVKIAWSTLHSLLHSENITCRQNAYIWLVDLLMAEIVEDDRNMPLNIGKLQQQISIVQDSADYSDISLSIALLCALLKSKDHIIRCGFLFVLERLLMRCKFLLDGSRIQTAINIEEIGFQKTANRLEKANAIVDIMSCALSLLAQINETDHLIILKMCSILFSQLCVRVPPGSEVLLEDANTVRDLRHCSSKGQEPDRYDGVSVFEEYNEKSDERINFSGENSITFLDSSIAVLLLQGHAVVPVRLVSRVPAALFYWPLIQLASAATDNISLGVSVGSKGTGNISGSTSDIRAALLFLLIGKCTADRISYQEVGGEEFFSELLDDMDSRVAYYSSVFLLKQMIAEEPEKYKRMLQSLVLRAQQSNNEKLLENPYLQMRGILQLSKDIGTPL